MKKTMNRKAKFSALCVLTIVVCLGAGASWTFGAGLKTDTPPYSDPPCSSARWARMESAVRKRINAFKGEIGLVIKDMKTGQCFEASADELFPSASMVKVPIMVACLKAEEEGRISPQERLKMTGADKTGGSGSLRRYRSGSSFTIDNLVELMVTRSDNTAANMIIDKLGFDYINGTFKEVGLEKTNLSRKLMDLRSRDRGVENLTTARETAEVLEKIYKKGCISPNVSDKCLEVLKQQKINDRIPRLLPRDAVVAHKTGLEREVCHDAGIVFTANGDFVISVFTKTWYKPVYAKRFIARVAALVYEVYKDGPQVAMLSPEYAGRAVASSAKR